MNSNKNLESIEIKLGLTLTTLAFFTSFMLHDIGYIIGFFMAIIGLYVSRYGFIRKNFISIIAFFFGIMTIFFVLSMVLSRALIM